jgi:hypothetical protein
VLSAVISFSCLVGAFHPKSINSLLDSLERYASWRKIRPCFGPLYFFAFVVAFFTSFVEGLGGVAGQERVFFALFGVGVVWSVAILITLAFRPHNKGDGPDAAGGRRSVKLRNIIKRRQNLLLFTAIGLAIGALDMILWCIFSKLPQLPIILSSLQGFMSTLWQVHAALMGVTVIVVAVVVTVVANEGERTRTWGLYMGHSKFLLIVWFNLWAIVNEAVVALLSESSGSSVVPPPVAGLVVSAGIVFLVSVFSAAWLYWVTTRFIDESYVEDLAGRRIVAMIPDEVDRQVEKLMAITRELRDRRT